MVPTSETERIQKLEQRDLERIDDIDRTQRMVDVLETVERLSGVWFRDVRDDN